MAGNRARARSGKAVQGVPQGSNARADPLGEARPAIQTVCRDPLHETPPKDNILDSGTGTL